MTEKLHPLHTIEFIADALRATGEYPGLRRTGRSTAQALRLISECIQRPGVWMQPHDHHGTTTANRQLLCLIQDTVAKLELTGFSFQDTRMGFGVQ